MSLALFALADASISEVKTKDSGKKPPQFGGLGVERAG